MTMGIEQKSRLEKAATGLIGAEMVYELCEQAAGFITDRHAAPQLSFEDQRRKRGEEEEREAKEAAQRAEQLKARIEAAEAARLSQLISEDVRRKEEMRAERERVEREKEKEGRTEFLELGPGGERVLAVTVRLGERNTSEASVKLGLATRGDWLGRTVPAEVSAGADMAISGQAYLVDILAPYFLTAPGKRKLGKVETDLDRVRAIRHPHLLSLYGSRLTRYTSTFFPPNPHHTQSFSRSSEGWSLVVLSEQPRASQTLEDLLATVGELRIDRTLSYFSQLVSAVECLHAANIMHKGVRPRAIWIGTEVKLGEAGWYQRLVDLNKSEPWTVAAAEDVVEGWVCPEVVQNPFTYDRKRDMWDVGVVFAQMMFGLDVMRCYASPGDLVRARESLPSQPSSAVPAC